MKAIDIASKISLGWPNPLTLGDVLNELIKEVQQLIQFRHAQKDTAIKAIIDEINNKWHIAVKLLAKRNYPDMDKIDPNMFIDRIKLEKAPSIQNAFKCLSPKRMEKTLRDIQSVSRLNRSNQGEEMAESDGILSDEQISNWRKVLCGMLGPYALIMPKEQIQRMRNKMQKQVSKIEEDRVKKESK
jgi:hypothetical protein